ncbi:MAG TPA: uracil-DNA glycosylase, partial [Gemmatimonadales bacterium]|nr:uracil-DNA glycosylase [Gemmatimonadales bacterium]
FAELTSLAEVAEVIAKCQRCPLFATAINPVPGEGNPNARLMLIGEGPGATEDATGRPFVGQAGSLLNGILEAIEVPRDSVYITNIVKCRPPGNRKPLPDEVAACIPYLYRQVELIKPKVILALGGTAGENLLGVRKSLGELRGAERGILIQQHGTEHGLLGFLTPRGRPANVGISGRVVA